MAWEPLTPEQQELRDLVRTIARERIAPRAAEIDATHEFPWDVVEAYRDSGIFGLFYAEEDGGTGTGMLLSARRDRGGVARLRDERPHSRRPGARLARDQARRLGRADAPPGCHGSPRARCSPRTR